MKAKKSFVLAACSLAGFLGSSSPSSAASYTEAKFTRLENEVKVLKENTAPHAATVGENVNAVTSVATGANSRAELQFPDKSLTRLGANSRFTIRGDKRTLDLDQGVMMLQVPKKMGGARVRTAAVTAAVTGTTAMFEYLPNGYIKLIVIEGEVDLYSNKNPSNYQVVHAGQMIIMDPNSTNIPPPVDVDLKRLLHTSKLLSQYENLPNTAQVNQAVLNQENALKDGTLLNTSLVIPGLGTVVSINNNTAHGLNANLVLQKPVTPTKPTPPANPGNNNSQPPPTNTGPVPPVFQGFLPLISGTTVLNNTSTIVPDPTVTAFNTGSNGVLTSQGLIYHGQTVDGPFAYFAFGSTGKIDPNLQAFLNSSNGWGSFKFDSLFINGTPHFSVLDTESAHITDVILAANGDINLAGNNPYGAAAGGPDGGEGGPSLNLTSTLLTGLVLYSQNGSINVGPNFRIVGTSQDLALSAQGLASDVNIQGNITLGGTGILVVGAGRDVLIPGAVSAADVTVTAHRDITVTGAIYPGLSYVKATKGNLTVSAIRHIVISNSAQLSQLANISTQGLMRIQSQTGNITIDKNSTLTGDNIEIQAFAGNISILNSNMTATGAFAARTLSPNGVLNIGGGTISAGSLIQLYAEGSNGTVLFSDNVTLTGSGVGTGSKNPVVQIAGKTVEVALGKAVDVTGAKRTVIFTDNAHYNITGYGIFQGTGDSGLSPTGDTKPFADRPKFNGSNTFGPNANGNAPLFARPGKTPGGGTGG